MKTWTGKITLLIFSSAGLQTRAASECSAELAAKKTPAPAANCGITAIAGVFEDPAT